MEAKVSETRPAKWFSDVFDVVGLFEQVGGIRGYCTGERRNGFQIPVFEKDEALKIAQRCGDIVFAPDLDEFRIETGQTDEPYEYVTGFDIEVEGETKHVYAIGDGWVWELFRG